MSWWKKDLNKTNSIIRKISHLRLNYIDLLEADDEVKFAREQFQKENKVEKKIERSPCMSLVPFEPKEENQQKPQQKPQQKQQQQNQPEPPPLHELSEEMDASKDDPLNSVPEKLRGWVKKIYRTVNVRLHPDKCPDSPDWFKEWLSSYRRCDWLQFIIFLENLPELFEQYPPPQPEFDTWVNVYMNVCLKMVSSIKNDKDYVWWKEKTMTQSSQENPQDSSP